MLKKLAIIIPFLILAALPAKAQSLCSWRDTVSNSIGQVIPNATVIILSGTVTGAAAVNTTTQPGTPLATIYQDPYGSTLINQSTNPINTSTGDGTFQFWGTCGAYVVIQAYGPGISGQYVYGVQLGGAAGGGGSGCNPIGINGNVLYKSGVTCQGAAGINTPDGNSLSITGPDPSHDVTAYMPVGGCDNTGVNQVPTAGTISSNSAALSISFDKSFKNGCGIFVYGAGPTSTLATPAQGSAPNPSVTGTTGATTVHYKVAAIDANYGTSAASAAITATSAPATRTGINYVGIYWQGVANAVGYLVYTDQNGGGTYVPLGYSFDCFGFTVGNVCGAIDKGVETYTWTSYGFWPTTPPVAKTAGALITTILSGAGTTSLVLAASASNSTVGTFTLPDIAPFVQSATTAAATDLGSVFIPAGFFYASTLPLPSSSTKNIHFLHVGTVELFGLPIGVPEATLPDISISGVGGIQQPENWTFNCAQIQAIPSLGALFVVSGALDLNNMCLNTEQSDVIQAGGSVNATDVSFGENGSGFELQVDTNSFFSTFRHVNFNDGGNASVNYIPAVWFLGLTNNSHSSVFAFDTAAFTGHTIRVDVPFPLGGNFGTLTFTGQTSIESSYDDGFINYATNSVLGAAEFDNVTTSDAMGGNKAMIYAENNNPPGGANNFYIHGITNGFPTLVGGAINVENTICRDWLFESSNNGGSGFGNIGYFGNLGGKYMGCDYGFTQTGYDVQTTEVLTSGGNDPNSSIGEQMVGHVFRRPITTLTPSSSGGSLGAGTYYIQVTIKDVAGRESAASPEVSATTTGSSGSIAVSAVSAIYFPQSCNVYFGTTSGGEAHYWNSTSVTNGTCTFTFTTTTSPTGAATPPPVGNAMYSWLSEEHNVNSCLFCGSSQGGTGALGIHLNSTQYANLQTNALASPIMSVEPGLFAALPSCGSASEGTFGSVTDSTTNTWGGTISGSGSDHVLAYCDGSNWTVVGK